jgi:hypothetical protein
MTSFDAWLDGQPTTDAGLAELFQLRSDLGAAWPTGAEGWAAYAAAIAHSPAVADKTKALAGLERAYRRFAPAPEARGFWATIAGWIGNVHVWATLVGGLIIFGLFSFALNDQMLAQLAQVERARGLITFLFAVATVGIALIIVLAIFLSTGTAEEVKERFQMGKDILAVLIGVFGTIIGFYFGSQLTQPEEPEPGIEAEAPPPAN